MIPDYLIYLSLDAGTLFFPFLLSFDRRVHFAKQWRSWLPAIPTTALIFILWDIWKTRQGVWLFNPRYIVGWYLDVLPLEEVLFFFAIPYSCLFIYACVKEYFPRARLMAPKNFWWVLSIGAMAGAIYFHDKLYTGINLAYAGALFFLSGFYNRKLGYLPLAYALHLGPFFLVNGVLTALPVVLYNDAETLSWRLGTIPVEDTLYSLNLLLTNILLFERKTADQSENFNK